MFSLWVRSKATGAEFAELFDAMAAGRAVAAETQEATEVRRNADNVIMAVSVPGYNDAGAYMARARKHNLQAQAGTAANDWTSNKPVRNLCLETDRPHVWWLEESVPSYLFRCQDCQCYGYAGRGGPQGRDTTPHPCRVCERPATWKRTDHRGRRQWFCEVHRPQ